MADGKFVLAREIKHAGLDSLPGCPVAIVRSQDPALDGLFLCAVGGDDDDLAPPPSSKAAGGPDLEADPNEAISKVPHADMAAEEFENDRAHVPSRAERVRARKQPQRYKERLQGGGPKENSLAAFLSDHQAKLAAAAAAKHKEKKVLKARHSEKADLVRLPLGSFFEPLPQVDEKKRTTVYTAGKAGSGKSVFSAALIRRYKKLFPHRKIYGVCKTKLANDPAYAELGIKQLPVSFFESTEGAAFDVEHAFPKEGCLVLFDDWDSLEKGEKKCVLNGIADILNLGRKMQISAIVTSHLLTNYNETRAVIHEANYVVLYPQHELYQSIYYLCQRLGVPKDMIGRLRQKGRWVMIHNSNPTYVLSETEAEMI